MSLLFNSLSLKNFGPYRDVTSLQLATTAEAPVVLVHGENTLGKTQLFAAIRWCLYGDFLHQQSPTDVVNELRERFNNPARRAGENELEVELVLAVEAQTYRLSRKARFEGNAVRTTATLSIDGSVVPQTAIAEEIGRVLHPQISEFFLFDAELLRRFYDRLSSDRERGFIRQTIEQVLGIPALQRAGRDVSDLSEESSRAQAKLLRDTAAAEVAKRRMLELKSKADSLTRDEEELLNDLEKATIAYTQVTEELLLIKDIEADARELQIYDVQIRDGDRETSTLEADMRELLTTGWLCPAHSVINEQLAKLQAQNSDALRAQDDLRKAKQRASVLQERIRGGNCPTCSQVLPSPDDSVLRDLEAVRSQVEALEAAGGGTVDLGRERSLTALHDSATIDRYIDKQRRLDDLLLLQYERRQAVSAIKDRLKGNSAADIRSMAQRAHDLEKAVKDLEQAIKKNREEATSVTAEQQKQARLLNRLPGADPVIALEAAFFSYVEQLFDSTIAKYREETRRNVEAQANEMFRGLIRDPGGYGGLRIHPDYRVELLDREGVARPTSEGGKQLLALALIGALKQAAVRGGPVVLDSPLGRLDLEHRANVMQNWVPGLGSQVILLVQSGELTRERARELLGDRLGRELVLRRPTNDPEVAVIEEGTVTA